MESTVNGPSPNNDKVPVTMILMVVCVNIVIAVSVHDRVEVPSVISLEVVGGLSGH